MYKTRRRSLPLSAMEKTVVEQVVKAEGGLSQGALVRRLNRDAARQHEIWSPDKQQSVTQLIQEVQHG